MILLTHQTPILLGVAPQDFRKGIDGFVSLCQNVLAQEPRSGTVFVFLNRARTMIRALSYDGSGYWLMTKRLSKGTFSGWPSAQGALSASTARELRIIIGGGVWQTPNVTNQGSSTLASAPVSATINTHEFQSRATSATQR